MEIKLVFRVSEGFFSPNRKWLGTWHPSLPVLRFKLFSYVFFQKSREKACSDFWENRPARKKSLSRVRSRCSTRLDLSQGHGNVGADTPRLGIP